MEAAVRFHRDTLGLPLKFQTPGWTEFETGDVTLALHAATAENPAGSVELGFGVDDMIRVRHAIAEQTRGESGWVSTSKTDVRNYRITMKNMHPRPIEVRVLDQIPVSQNETIKIELLGRTQPTRRNVDERRGVLAWDMTLAPNEEKIVEFGYRVSWPAARSVVYAPGS